MFEQIRDAAFSDLVGKTIKEIRGAEEGSDEVMFVLDDGTEYRMHHHHHACCECVYLVGVIGDITDIIGSPIVSAEEVSTSDGDRLWEYDGSLWPRYELDTAKGGVTLRWYGSSNGYYSERVSFDKLGYHK